MQKFYSYNQSIKFFFVFLIFAVSFQGNTFAQSNDSTSNLLKPDTNLRVGIAGSSPFIINRNGNYSGISFEIWEALASKTNWKYSTQYFSTVSDAITFLQNGKIDILVGPISITSERATHVSFSQPYYQSSLSIMSNVEKFSLWHRIAPFFSIKLLIAVIIFLFILSIVGTLVWLAERKRSPEQFPPKPAIGIANGMWLAIVTMTTTGYGDKAPVTLWGRIITGSWMIISIVFATTMVAGIASTLTLTAIKTNTISTVEQLAGKKVAVIKNSPAVEFTEESNAEPVEVENLDEAYQDLKNKTVAAIVYDRPELVYYIKKNGIKNMQVSKAEYYKQGYGFALPLNSPLVKKINIELLNLSEENRITQIVKSWLGDENK